MTTYHKCREATVWMLCLLLFLACANTQANNEVNLSSPEATIETYCKAEDIRTIKKCFYSDAIEDKSFKKRIWSECVIIDKRPTDKIGRQFGGKDNLVVKEGDIEIITEVRMIDASRNNPRTRFWYLLRNFGGEWKIISYSHIPDKNYPAYD